MEKKKYYISGKNNNTDLLNVDYEGTLLGAQRAAIKFVRECIGNGYNTMWFVKDENFEVIMEGVL